MFATPRMTLLLSLLLLGLRLPAGAQPPASYPTQTVGKYAIALRLPPEGLFAGEETDIEFRITDASQDDPVQGAPPIVNARIKARVTMPAMASMPAQTPGIHSESVPGDYGVVIYFPHGGDYRLDFRITPPGDKPFAVSFKVPVNDAEAAKGRKPKPKPYALEVSSHPGAPQAGEPTDLTLVILKRDTHQPVTEFDTVHERSIHLMIVSADLSQFAHVHPIAGADGKFTLRYAFPTGGEYHLFADVAPHGAGAQILLASLKVNGPAPPVRNSTLGPSLTDTVAGVSLALQSDPQKIPVGRTLPLVFTLKKETTGEPITDLQPWLGAMAHLMLLHQDGVTFVHCHPDESDPANGTNGSITFLARFPKPGVYRGWLQFQRAGEVQTAVFTMQIGGQAQ